MFPRTSAKKEFSATVAGHKFTKQQPYNDACAILNRLSKWQVVAKLNRLSDDKAKKQASTALKGLYRSFCAMIDDAHRYLDYDDYGDVVEQYAQFVNDEPSPNKSIDGVIYDLFGYSKRNADGSYTAMTAKEHLAEFKKSNSKDELKFTQSLMKIFKLAKN